MVVVCLGEALIDLVPPTGESPRTASHLAIQPGGAPLNIAVGLSRLECDALFLGCLSQDAFGTRLSEVLDERQIRRTPSDSVPNPTRLAVVDHSNSIIPFRFYGDSPADSRLTRKHVEEAFGKGNATGLYVGSLMMTNADSAATQRYAIERACEMEIPVYADPNPRPSAWSSDEQMIEVTEYLIENSSVAKLSVDDASILGWPADPGELIDWCESRFGAQMFVTGGAAGCWAKIDGELHHVQPPAIVPVDSTGAGDASFSALIASILESHGLTEEGLRWASAAGAITTLSQGAITAFPGASQIESFLANRT